LLLGLDRKSASRFAFLLSIPTILLAGGYEGLGLLSATVPVDWYAVTLVLVISCVAAALTIHFFIRFLDWTGMLPYVIYRLVLGVLLLYLFI
jgi:undecaprenyl-diphosphatase